MYDVVADETDPLNRDAGDIVYPSAIPFVLVHLACFAALWTGVRAVDLAVMVALYYVRMFGVTAGYHRYFSHRTFKTSRLGQFLLAFLAQSSAQQGVLWWAARHRHHHKYSDMPNDVHSPRHHGLLYAHVGWIFDRRNFESAADLERVKDLSKYPELVWLNKHKYLPPALVGLVVWLIGGWPSLVVGFLWSTVLLWHGTFTINSLSHGWGRRRFYTGDDSRNNWILSLVTLGEGWHNNHHYFQSSVRQGFRWYEIDITYYVLKALSWLGLVWDIREPPREVVLGRSRLSREQVFRAEAELVGVNAAAVSRSQAERAFAALKLAASESMGPIAARARATLAQIAASMHPYADRAQEAWLAMIEQATARIAEAKDSFDQTAEAALQTLLDAAHAIEPVASRARAALQTLAHSMHPYAERAREALSELTSAPETAPQPA